MDVPFPALLTCTVTPAGPDVRVVVAGVVPLATAAHLEHVLDAQVRAAEPGGRLSLDLSGVEFCAAVGARVLADAAGSARDRGVELHLAPRSAAVDLALDICGWSALIDPDDLDRRVIRRIDRARRTRRRLAGR